MKWSPQPKDECSRPDCDKQARQWGFCINHSHLWRRNGAPYTQQELVEMREANKHAQDMELALQLNPPQITWRKDKHGIFRAVSVQDPHAETKAQREWDARISREQVALLAMQEEADAVAERLRKHRADNTPLMAAARTEL